MTKKVLIIDDDPIFLRLVDEVLAQQGYEVLKAGSGQESLRLLFTERPDIVLLDLTMPDIDGVDVLKIIRKVSDVPVLIITAHPEDIVDIHLGGLTISGYVEKPFSLSEILNTLKHLIGE